MQVAFDALSLQFQFPTLKAVPQSMRRLKRPAPVRKDHTAPPGQMIIQPTDGTSAVTLLADLKANGYLMISATCEERRNTNTSGCYYMMRFFFSKTKGVISDFRAIRKIVEHDLQKIAEEALWKVQVFSNPVVEGIRVIPDRRAANVCFNARKPFIQGDGQPVTVRPRDASGEPTGAPALPLAPSHHLRFADSSFDLLAMGG